MIYERVELIQNSVIRSHFVEIKKCIDNGSYRAAVVLLWSVAVLDLVNKVQELKDVYSNVAANSVLNEIEQEWNDNPTSSSWENKILKDCKERVKNISLAQYEVLNHLHQIRHLCAHPIKDSNWDLYIPTKKEVMYFFECALDLAIVPAYLSHKDFGEFLDDIACNSAIYESESDFSEFLNQKYYRLLDDKSQKYYLKNLWKFCFKKLDDNCQNNRSTNLKALIVLMKKMGEDSTKKAIVENVSDFSDISLTNENIFEKYIELSLEFPYNFSLLERATQIGIKNCISKTAYYSTIAFFIQSSFSEHLDELVKKPVWDIYEEKRIDVEALSRLLALDGLTSSEKSRLLSIAINCYVKSEGFDYSDKVFELLIGPNIDLFSDNQLENLIDGIDSNHETYERKRAPYDHGKILEEIKKRNISKDRIEKMNEILGYKHY